MKHIFKAIMSALLFCSSIVTFAIFPACLPDPFSFPLDEALSNGKPTLAEFGGTNCAPCKSMWPILKEIASENKDYLNVVILDVAKFPEIANKYDVKIIPVQLYFEATGGLQLVIPAE